MKHFVLLMLFLSLASSVHARQIIDLSLGYRDMHNGMVEIDYYMSRGSASQGVTLQIVDLITGRIESSWPLSRDGVVDQKATIGMRCSSGVKVAYMFIGGVPSVNMKMFVSK